MLLIKADRRFNPNKLRLVLSLSISVFFSLIIIFLCAKLTDHLIKQTEKQFDESCRKITDSYAQSVSLKIETYLYNLNGAIDDVLTSENNGNIQETLKKIKKHNHPDVMNISFVDIDGTGWPQSGMNYDASTRDYFDAIIRKGHKSFISGPIISYINNEPIFLIAKRVETAEGRLKGIITASVALSSINTIIQGLIFDFDGYLFILNEYGKFIAHPNHELLQKSFIPKDETYKKYSSEMIARAKSGKYKSKSASGEIIYVYSRPINNTNWTLGFVIPEFALEKFNKQADKYRVLIVLLGIIIMLLLTIVESRFIRFLQKHQHIDAIYDSITNLLTRKRFELEASRMLRKNRKCKFMLLETDIRGFKFINQNYGEEIADNMIIYLSHILNRHAMHSGGITGRGFADHFYSLYKVDSVRKAMRTFRDYLPLINERTKSYPVPFTAKFGIAFLMPDSKNKGNSIQELINQASFAKTTIKDSIITQYSIYNSRLLSKINEERFIETHMEDALRKHEFFVMYQPKISLENEKIVGAEALVRWQNPRLGLLSPNSFIPLFERNGFITKLDFYVYEEVFKFMEKQIAEGNPIVPVSVNMSRNHSKPEKFMHDFLDIFKKYSIPSNLIQVEIIERSMMDNNTLKEITENLHREGFTVAMDDFGSGESSLNMLTKIPVDVLKFDQEFLNTSHSNNGQLDKKSADFIEILIEMSKVLEKETVFEGVETQEQRDFLKSIHCDEVQGYFYSKPLSAADFVEFIKLHI